MRKKREGNLLGEKKTKPRWVESPLAELSCLGETKIWGLISSKIKGRRQMRRIGSRLGSSTK